MKKAFTLLEIIFVIVIIGIVTAVVLPRTQDDGLEEAAIQLLSDIRYTQHLALTDDKYDSKDIQWHKGRWQIVFSHSIFSKDKPAYTIFSDKDFGRGYSGDPTKTEVAEDPQRQGYILTGGYGTSALDIRDLSVFKGTKRMNLGLSFGITSVRLSNGCHYARLSFDYLGRPMTGDQSTLTGSYKAGTQRLIHKDCVITLFKHDKNISIIVKPETGYAKVNF